MKYNIGDYSSILAVIITIVGFALTLVKVFQSTKASKEAQRIVENIKKEISKSETVIDIATIIAVLDEIVRLHRDNNWVLLPERHRILRRLLLDVKNNYPHLNDEQKSTIQSTIQHMKSVEEGVEIAILSKISPQKVARIISTVSTQSDKLYELLNDIKSKIGG